MIDETEFGIDETNSSITFQQTDEQEADYFPDAPRQYISIELQGCQKLFDSIIQQVDSPWSWALYPPHLYLRSFPADPDETGAISVRVTLDDIGDYEVALYMIEHNDIEHADARVIPGRSMTIQGVVNLCGESHRLRCTWDL